MDEAKVEAFAGKVFGDMSASAAGMMLSLGNKLGLYKAMAGAGPLTVSQLAKRAGCDERYLLEWLNSQVAGEFLAYDPAANTYELPEEHAMVLANEESPAFVAAGFECIAAMWYAKDTLADRIKTGKGMGWHEQDKCLFFGIESFFRPGYKANLVDNWLPACGLKEKLEAGAQVADVGCGHGASTIIMAKAFPKSTFHGFDYHDKSIEVARQRAKEAGVSDRVSFDVASAKDFPGSYDIVCYFDCFHDLGDPVGAAKHTREALKPGGSVFMVEPLAADGLENNINPVSRMFYAASTAMCCPNALDQEPKVALGAQAGEERLRKVLSEGGFKSVRRATETPFNMILDVRA